MSRRLVFSVALVLTILAAGIAPTVQAAPNAQEDTVHLRLVHAVADAPAVDVLVDGALAASQLAYAEYTPYLVVTPGDHTISVQAGEATIAEATVTLTAGQALTGAVMGTAAAPEIMAFEDNLSPLVLGNIRLSALHAVSGAGAVDMLLSDGTPVLQGLEYATGAGEIDIPANAYPLAVAPTGGTVDEAIRPAADYALRGGMFYRLMVLAGTPDVLMLEAPVLPSADSVWVRFAHGIAGAPAVDVYLDEALFIPNLQPNAMTQHVALPGGSYEVSVRPAGEADTAAIATATLDISDPALAGQAQTFAVVENGGVSVEAFADDYSDLDATAARINVLNAVPGSEGLTVSLSDGTAVASGEIYADPASTEAAPGAYTLTVETAEGGTASMDVTLNGGTLYSVLVAGSADAPVLMVGESALNRQPGSAAVAGAPAEAAAEEPASEEPAAAEAEAEATEAEAQPPAQETEAPAPTAVPTQAPQTAPPADGLLGVVINLNPGANLQLREYPRADARSLGLASAGTVVTVIGRAGEPDFEALPNLGDETDLDPTETWLLVQVNMPDGGTITAWVIALYVDVTDNGERVRLIELDPQRSDVPGEASGTAAAAPTVAPVDAEFFGTIFNLNPGANLHLRRTPESVGESLALLPAGTIVAPEGILADYTWTFVTYTAEDGSVVTGWVATDFLQFVFRGTNYLPLAERIDELILRNLLDITEPDVRGEISEGAAPGGSEGGTAETDLRDQIIGTTVLDPGANLHLRRSPDAASESLALIPSGAVLIVLARTPDSTWLQVEYDEQTGWVASSFVELTRNNQRVDISEVFDIEP